MKIFHEKNIMAVAMTYSDRKSKMHVLEVILHGHQILFFFRRINVHFGVNKFSKLGHRTSF